MPPPDFTAAAKRPLLVLQNYQNAKRRRSSSNSGDSGNSGNSCDSGNSSSDSDGEKIRYQNSQELYAIAKAVSMIYVGDIVLVNLSGEHQMNDSINRCISKSIPRDTSNDQVLNSVTAFEPMHKKTIVSVTDGLRHLLTTKLISVSMIISISTVAEAADAIYYASGFRCCVVQAISRYCVFTAWIPGIVFIPPNIFTRPNRHLHVITLDRDWFTKPINSGKVYENKFESEYITIEAGIGPISRLTRTFSMSEITIADISTIVMTMDFMRTFKTPNDGTFKCFNLNALRLVAAFVTAIELEKS